MSKVCSICNETKELDCFQKWRRQCKECRKVKIKNYNKKYKDNNKEKNKIKVDEYKLKNIDKINDYQKKYKIENKDKLNEYFKNKYNNDPLHKIKVTHRNRLNKLIKKVKSSKDYLGCDLEMLMNWIEFQFTEEMSWDNHGTYWHLDHFMPCASFDLTNIDEQEQCFNWTNMQPLEANRNISKSDKVPEIREILIMELKLKQFELISK